MTDPNSIYRKLYNRNMDFFLWILEREQAPFVFKLHVQAKNKKDMNVAMVKRSIQALVSQKTIAEASLAATKKASSPKISVQYFTKKK